MTTTDTTQKDLRRTHGAKLEKLAALLGLSLEWSTRDNRDYYPATLRGGRLEPDYYLAQSKDIGRDRIAIYADFTELYRATGRGRDPARPGISIGISLTRPAKSLAADIQKRLIIPAKAEYKRQHKLITEIDAKAAEELAQVTQLLAPFDLSAKDTPTLADTRAGREIRLYKYGLIRTSAHELTAPYRDSAARLEIEVRNPDALAQSLKILAADARAATEAKAV